jgi:hypothetical protein
MPKEPENLVLALLREIRSKQDEQTAKLDVLEGRVRHVESQLDDLHVAVTYSLGQSSETQLKQTKQSVRIDELFAQLEKLVGKEDGP